METEYMRWIDIIPNYIWEKMTKTERLLLIELDKCYFKKIEFRPKIRAKSNKRDIKPIHNYKPKGA